MIEMVRRDEVQILDVAVCAALLMATKNQDVDGFLWDTQGSLREQLREGRAVSLAMRPKIWC
jgi:hypothetical protein